GRRPSLAVLYEAWVGSQEDLEPALKELLAWKVINIVYSSDGGEHFWPNPASLWEVPGSSGL
ncbi:MAG: hypothetical protein LBK52_07260, partial [Deltaproteobacteria bacterium]|nr:hypothetical protein [Deltaproteobacteria bacterium]